MNTKGNPQGAWSEWYCLLFQKILNSWNIYDKKEQPERCGDCKILTKRFENIPELDEG